MRPERRNASWRARGGKSAGWRVALLGLLVASLLPAARADASALIDNGTIQLGVEDRGHLNVPGGPPASDGSTTTVGLRYMPNNAEALGRTPYEGWGAADATSHITGFANSGLPGHPSFNAGLEPVTFAHTANGAISVVNVVGAGAGAGALPTLRVTHDFHPAQATPNLYEVAVTIKNVSSIPVDPRYRRVMDWDIPPTPHDEFVTIAGTPFPELLWTSNAGFSSPDPLTAPDSNSNGTTQIYRTGSFVDHGPLDQGAQFDFGFDTLAPGASITFYLYYGATANQDDAEQAVAAVGARTWSFGQPNTPDGPALGTPNTFIFAFSDGVAPTADDLRLQAFSPAAIDGPGQFDVRANVSNHGSNDATSVDAQIAVPPGLTLVTPPSQHAYGTLHPGDDADHTWTFSAPAQCQDNTYPIDVTGSYVSSNGTVSLARHRSVLVRGTCGVIHGRVVDRHTGVPLVGALVTACPHGCATTATDALGNYAISGLVADTYNLGVVSGAYAPETRSIVVAAGDHVTADFALSDLHAPGAGSAVGPLQGTTPDGLPLIGRVPTTLTEAGCVGAAATFTVTSGTTVLASGAMSESPAGQYTSPAFGPYSRPVVVLHFEIRIVCPDDSVEESIFDAIYIDPSGNVRTTAGSPVAGATVVLLRSADPGGPFTQVPDGDAIMSPANRKNPDASDAAGHFGWDVTPGYYKVRASKAGCTGPDAAPFVESAALLIPPPVTDLDLRLSCPGSTTPDGPPDTTITSGPGEGATGSDRTPKFTFSSTKPGSTFECRVDGRAFASCASPHTTAALGYGRHAFEVRAIDVAGHRDESPARRGFRVARRVAADVRITRHGTRISVVLRCPRDAASTCKVVLRLTKPGKRRATVTLVTRRVNLAAGGKATLFLRRSAIASQRKRVRLHVQTTTLAGTRAATFAIPR